MGGRKDVVMVRKRRRSQQATRKVRAKSRGDDEGEGCELSAKAKASS